MLGVEATGNPLNTGGVDVVAAAVATAVVAAVLKVTPNVEADVAVVVVVVVVVAAVFGVKNVVPTETDVVVVGGVRNDGAAEVADVDRFRAGCVVDEGAAK